MGFNIVLVEPEIPNNTGNIGRLSLAAGCKLHLVKPFGFELNDKRVKRAGLDYWKHLSVSTYENLDDFFFKNKDEKMVFLSSKSENIYSTIAFEKNMFLVFGKESVGLNADLILKNKSNSFKIPIYSKKVRSLNLANAVSIVVYEGLKKLY
jgi:tRNA (cytidine/uridine-2'-O-)-methyltransferase